MSGQRTPGLALDLHTHSSVSDGTEPPDDVVRAAQASGVAGIALTDHDTTAGWAAAVSAAEECGLALLPGMELSARLGWRSIHVLAYLVDPFHPGLLDETDRIRKSRLGRAERMVHRIAADFDIDWDDVLAHTSDGATVGRPHIADALVRRGHAESRTSAFQGILHPRAGYYEPHYAPDPLTAVQLIREAGGVPVLAHPATRGRDRMLEDDTFAELADAGLFGLEIGHRENTEDGKRALRDLAARLDLVTTGSSDYHGTGKPNRLGENTTDLAVAEAIVAEATGSSPVNFPPGR